jgi:YggT family protein
MHALFWLIDTALSLFVWALIIGAVVSLLIAFNVLDTRNRAVWAIADFFHRLTEPVLRPIRRFLPNLGGIDLSPVVLILLLQAGRILLAEIQYGLLGSGLGR